MDENCVIKDWIRSEVLGSGSFGVVCLWRNIKTNEELAVKMCKWGGNSQLTPKHKERWTKEVEMMNQIKHENIIGTKILPKELEDGLIVSNLSKLPILCMEYCKLGDLRQVLNKIECSNGLPEKQVRAVLKDLKNAICYLHSLNITHRDLKPENILLCHNGNDESNITYKLIDLGYAKEIGPNSVDASIVGTLQYIAPELLYSSTYSNTVDYWSFGLVAHEVITGIRPFLPNLPPAQWMKLVEKKTQDQICVFENLKGQIEYSESIFTENYVSLCFRNLIVKWLRVALDWDPKKRGHSADDKSVKFLLPGEENEKTTQETSKESSLVIFTLLDSILTKKVLTIFSSITYEYLSYEIDDFTLFSTVQIWVERDTKVPKEKHLFISKSHLTVDTQTLAHKYWHSELVSLYFFQTDCLIKEKVEPKLSSKLKYCLEQPKLKLSYSLLIGVFTSSLHFVKTQKDLYETLIKAHGLRISHTRKQVDKLHQTHKESDKVFARLMEKCHIISSILEINDKHFSESSTNFPSEYLLALKKCKNLNENALKLNEAWIQLTTRLQSASRRCTEIDEEEIIQKLCTNSFSELENYTVNFITAVNRIPREERGVARYCVDAIKIVYKCLKLRDILLQNIHKQQTMQKILDINFEMDKMQNLIKCATEKATLLSQCLSEGLMEREYLTMKLLNKSCITIADNNYLPTVLPNGKGEVKRHRIDFKIGEAVRDPYPSYTDDVEKKELELLLSDNFSVQKDAQACLKKCYDIYKSMQEEMDVDDCEI